MDTCLRSNRELSGREGFWLGHNSRGSKLQWLKTRVMVQISGHGEHHFTTLCPQQLITWIDNFCSERTATLTVNGYCSDLAALPQAGLPQGSPLSPILFLFF